jgi:sortase A
VHARLLIRSLSWLLLAAGVVLIAWGLVTWRWGDPVTGMYTRWEQRKLADEYRVLARSYAAPPVVPAESPAERRARLHRAATRFHARAEQGGAIGRIRIGKLGLDMVLLEGTDSGTLKKGPGRDARTFMPGEGQLVYIAGHRTTYGAPFAHIDKLRAGDRVELEMPYGTFRYRVTRSVIVPADDLGRLRSRGREQVALQACHPRFSASQRLIVYALPTRAPAGAGSAAAAGSTAGG